MAEKRDRFDKFLAQVEFAINWMKEHTDEEGNVPWKMFDKQWERTLVLRKRQEFAIEEPEDNFMDLEEYTLKHGNPKTNGLNHKCAKVGKRDIVIIPCSGMGKIRRITLLQGDVDMNPTSSSSALTGQDALESMQQAFATGMVPRATGASLTSLQGSPSGSGDGRAARERRRVEPPRGLRRFEEQWTPTKRNWQS